MKYYILLLFVFLLISMNEINTFKYNLVGRNLQTDDGTSSVDDTPPLDDATPPPLDDAATTPPLDDAATPPPLDDATSSVDDTPPVDDATPPPLDDATSSVDDTPPLDDAATPPSLDDAATTPPLDDATSSIDDTPPLDDAATTPPLDDAATTPPLDDAATPPPFDDGVTLPPSSFPTVSPHLDDNDVISVDDNITSNSTTLSPTVSPHIDDDDIYDDVYYNDDNITSIYNDTTLSPTVSPHIDDDDIYDGDDVYYDDDDNITSNSTTLSPTVSPHIDDDAFYDDDAYYDDNNITSNSTTLSPTVSPHIDDDDIYDGDDLYDGDDVYYDDDDNITSNSTTLSPTFSPQIDDNDDKISVDDNTASLENITFTPSISLSLPTATPTISPITIKGNIFVSSLYKISSTQGGNISLGVSSFFGWSIDIFDDLNNDGIQDVAISSWGDESNDGCIYFAYLQTNGFVSSYKKIDSTNFPIGVGLSTGGRFGYDLANIYDLNDDFSDDVVISAPYIDDGAAASGAIFIIFLDSDQTIKTFVKISRYSESFKLSAGDVFGISVCFMKDIDNDEIIDIGVGASGDDDGVSNSGSFYILYLATNGYIKSYTKFSRENGFQSLALSTGDEFGRSSYIMGGSDSDLDQDGYMDFVIGAPKDDDNADNSGSLYIIYLDSNRQVKKFSKISNTSGSFTGFFDTNGRFGTDISSIGHWYNSDIDGDSVPDIISSSYNNSKVFFLMINKEGKIKTYFILSGLEDDRFSSGGLGSSISSFAKDFDGDTFLDIIVGAALDDDGDTNAGAIYILSLFGNTTSSPTISPTQMPTNSSNTSSPTNDITTLDDDIYYDDDDIYYDDDDNITSNSTTLSPTFSPYIYDDDLYDGDDVYYDDDNITSNSTTLSPTISPNIDDDDIYDGDDLYDGDDVYYDDDNITSNSTTLSPTVSPHIDDDDVYDGDDVYYDDDNITSNSTTLSPTVSPHIDDDDIYDGDDVDDGDDLYDGDDIYYDDDDNITSNSTTLSPTISPHIDDDDIYDGDDLYDGDDVYYDDDDNITSNSTTLSPTVSPHIDDNDVYDGDDVYYYDDDDITSNSTTLSPTISPIDNNITSNSTTLSPTISPIDDNITDKNVTSNYTTTSSPTFFPISSPTLFPTPLPIISNNTASNTTTSNNTTSNSTITNNNITISPTLSPTLVQTLLPTSLPVNNTNTLSPTTIPSISPTNHPTLSPTISPTPIYSSINCNNPSCTLCLYTNLSYCLTCEIHSYKTIQNNCILCNQSCKSCYNHDDSSCLSCYKGKYLKKSNSVCNLCHPSCESCNGQYEDECLSCQNKNEVYFLSTCYERSYIYPILIAYIVFTLAALMSIYLLGIDPLPLTKEQQDYINKQNEINKNKKSSIFKITPTKTLILMVIFGLYDFLSDIAYISFTRFKYNELKYCGLFLILLPTILFIYENKNKLFHKKSLFYNPILYTWKKFNPLLYLKLILYYMKKIWNLIHFYRPDYEYMSGIEVLLKIISSILQLILIIIYIPLSLIGAIIILLIRIPISLISPLFIPFILLIFVNAKLMSSIKLTNLILGYKLSSNELRYLFNSSIFVEVIIESIPQLFIIIINTIQTNKLNLLALISIIGSSLNIINSIITIGCRIYHAGNIRLGLALPVTGPIHNELLKIKQLNKLKKEKNNSIYIDEDIIKNELNIIDFNDINIEEQNYNNDYNNDYNNQKKIFLNQKNENNKNKINKENIFENKNEEKEKNNIIKKEENNILINNNEEYIELVNMSRNQQLLILDMIKNDKISKEAGLELLQNLINKN